jgi:hypothetical protein
VEPLQLELDLAVAMEERELSAEVAVMEAAQVITMQTAAMAEPMQTRLHKGALGWALDCWGETLALLAAAAGVERVLVAVAVAPLLAL